jgi:hypothetical protein
MMMVCVCVCVCVCIDRLFNKHLLTTLMILTGMFIACSLRTLIVGCIITTRDGVSCVAGGGRSAVRVLMKVERRQTGKRMRCRIT